MARSALLHGIYCIFHWVNFANLRLRAKTTHLMRKIVNTRLTKIFIAIFAPDERLPPWQFSTSAILLISNSQHQRFSTSRILNISNCQNLNCCGRALAGSPSSHGSRGPPRRRHYHHYWDQLYIVNDTDHNENDDPDQQVWLGWPVRAPRVLFPQQLASH